MKLSRLPLLVKIIIAIILGVMFGQVVPDFAVRTMNTVVGLFDQLLRFLIPLIIVGLVTPAIADVGDRAGKMLLITVVMAYAFTVFSGLFAYAFSTALFPSFLDAGAMAQLEGESQEFLPYFEIKIPPLADVMTALVVSFMLGLGIAFFKSPTLKCGFDELKDIVVNTIEKVVIPILPIYIFGIFLDITAVGKVASVLSAFVAIVVIIFAMTIILLLLQYSLAGAVTRRNPLPLLRNMLPAYFTALGTSSSAATIPVTLKRAIANGVSEPVAGFVIPLCATIHLSGSTLKITSCAVGLMILLGMPFDFPMFLGFVMMLGVTMVAAPGVPGGAIMAALGVLSGVLGFDSQQQAMMITLYIAMDSFGTACNVTGDGAIALIIDKLHRNSILEKKEEKISVES